MPVAAVDTRFRTPVGNVNASPASVECYATGKAEPFFIAITANLEQIQRVCLTLTVTFVLG